MADDPETGKKRINEGKREQMEKETLTFEEILEKKGYLVYTNVGYSMLPLLRQRRDIIEIHRKDPAVRCKRYDVVLYKYGGKYILHRVVKVRPQDYVICGDHNRFCEYGITDREILGVLTRVIRDGKSIYPTDWRYRLYVHLWCDCLPARFGMFRLRDYAAAGIRKIKRLLKREKRSEV